MAKKLKPLKEASAIIVLLGKLQKFEALQKLSDFVKEVHLSQDNSHLRENEAQEKLVPH